MSKPAQAPWGTPYVGEFEVHPAALLFPEMSQDDLSALSDDIEKNGVRNPIVFCDGKLLDGRNRVRAVAMAGLNPGNPKDLPRTTLTAGRDPYAYAWSQNCERLNYDRKEKARIRLKVLEASGEFERQRTETAKAANESRSAKQKGIPKGNVEPHGEAPRSRTPSKKTAAKVAATLGVSRATVERMQRAEREEAGEAPPRPMRRHSQQRTITLPFNVDGIVAGLRQRLTSEERREVASRLWTEADAAAAVEE